MKFRQIAKDLFQVGVTDIAVLRVDSGHWRAGLIQGEDFISAKHGWRERKWAAKKAIEFKNEPNYFTGPPLKIASFGPANKRPAPPRPFLESLRKL